MINAGFSGSLSLSCSDSAPLRPDRSVASSRYLPSAGDHSRAGGWQIWRADRPHDYKRPYDYRRRLRGQSR